MILSDDQRSPPPPAGVDAFCDAFEAAWLAGHQPRIEDFLPRGDPAHQDMLLQELLLAEWDLRQEHGPQADLQAYLVRFPENQPAITDLWRIWKEERSDSVLNGRAVDSTTTQDGAAQEAVGTVIDRYKLLEKLGEGGFGTVWAAEQRQPVKRRVALKIIKLGMDTRQVVARFEAERQALAVMDHANIAKVFDAGATESGRPYFVMELIRGIPITEYCDQERLNTQARLDLFMKVCHAIQHAHQKGIIHRDIKPSNILVTLHDGVPVPKVIDFGVAKAIQQELTEKTIYTQLAQFIGTPAYMSPEQAEMTGLDIDTRSDIYSLGVLLYELLTGVTPFDAKELMRSGLDEMRKIIREKEPQTPSSRLTMDPQTKNAGSNESVSVHPRSAIDRDLDWIVMKALEKDRTRRYDTAGNFAADVLRHLSDQPVEACPPSAAYRFRKFVRRNKAALLTLAIVTAALILGAVGSTWQAIRATRAETLAETATAVTDGLYDSLLQEIRLTREVRNQGYGEKVRQLVDRARHLPTTRVDKDELRRQLLLSMGDFAAYPPVVIRPVRGQVSSICWSHDEREIIAGLDNGRLSAYDIGAGQQRNELEAFAGQVQSIALSADGNRLSAADETGEVRAWRRVGNKWNAERTIRAANKPGLHTVALSPDGELVADLNGPVIEVWNVATESKLSELPIDPDWTIKNAAFDMAHRRLVAGYVSGTTDSVGLALWDLDSGERLHLVTLPSLGDTRSNAIDLARDGGRLAIGFDDALLVYEMANFQRTSGPNSSSGDAVKAVAFSPTNPYLATVNFRGRITVWNSVTNRQLAILRQPGRGSSRDDILFSPDGSHLAASNGDSIHVWDLTRADETTVMAGHEGGIPCVAFHPNGRLLASGSKDEHVRFWNPSTGELLRSIGVGERVQALAFTSEGRLLAVGCNGGTGAPHLKLIDVQSGDILREQDPGVGGVNSLAWADRPDGKYLAACGPTGVALWKTARDGPFVMEQALKLDRKRCLATTLNREGSKLIWAQDQSRLQAWDIAAARQQPLHAPLMLAGWHGVTFLPEGHSIIYVSKSGVAEIWNVEQDRRVNSIGEPGTFNAPHVALSPDGKWFAALTQPDWSVSVWRLPSGKQLFTLRPEAGEVWSLAWDASSSQLAVGQSDGSLAVWHLPRIQKKLAEAGLPWQDND